MIVRDADPRLLGVLAAAFLACLVTALYLPFLGNPLVFDDRAFFSGHRFADYAAAPFALELRRPPYFSIAFTQVFTGSREAHRLVSLAVHAGSALALFWALISLRLAPLPAFFAAACFALHPAAVYAAGYLVQRTILLATLFSLVSLVLFVRGLAAARYPGAASAAAAYWVAVLSKEHSVLLPAAVLLSAPLVTPNWRFAVRYGALYAACCAPAAIFVLLLSLSVLATPYEPGLGTMAPQVQAVASSYPAGSAWLASVLAQAGLFFRYLAIWLWPAVSAMAIDMPIDLAGAWSGVRGWAGFAAFAGLGAAAVVLVLRSRGSVRVLGYGLIFTWIAFLVEFSSVRFQEPFVLYRSYLWAPGLAIAAAALLARLPTAAVMIAGIAAIAVLSVAAVDRLRSLSSPLATWEDAAAKLPAEPVPGAPRTLFNLAREQFYAGKPENALATLESCAARHAQSFYCYFGRGSLRLQQGDHAAALRDLDRALALQQDSGMAHHHRGVALEGLGRLAEAWAAYNVARKLRFGAAAYRLRLLDERRDRLGLIRSAAPRQD